MPTEAIDQCAKCHKACIGVWGEDILGEGFGMCRTCFVKTLPNIARQ